LPLLTIIISTHLRPLLLKRAIQSVLNSTFIDYEILVISDTRCDATFQAVHAFQDARINLFFHNRGTGPAYSRNFGLSVARGQHILFLDDDDAVEARYLEQVLKLAVLNPAAGIYSSVTIVEEDRQRQRPLKEYAYDVASLDKAQLYVKNFIHNHSIVYPKFKITNRSQEPSLASLEDWDFLLSALDEGMNLVFNPGEAKPVVYKDYINANSRRGNAVDALNENVIYDYLHIYSRHPAPSAAIAEARRALFRPLLASRSIESLIR
jgi:GalNAc5-diNAcBac-PP-undecaprenol beta-1,3-glucosyltransferase